MAPLLKSLISEKELASRKKDKGRLAKACQELAEWHMLHSHYQDAINEYMDLVSIYEVSW